MITTKILDDKVLIEDACALLYETYIEHYKWKFEPDNPSNLRVEARNGRKLLIDRFTDSAIWFGAFQGKRLIGCGRLTKIDANKKFEVENYKNSVVISEYLHKEKALELGKISASGAFQEKKTLHHLFLFAFEYCLNNGYAIFSAIHDQYIKNLFAKMNFPLKVERAFKYEEHDPMEVNFYYASHKADDQLVVIGNLKNMIFSKVNVTNTLHNKFTIFDALEMVAPVLPVLFYWHDKQGVVLGINERCLKAIGGTREKIVGHSPYDFYPKKVAEHILKHNEEVMRTGEVLFQEETINNITTGKLLHGLSVKAPLYDDDDQIVGIVGTSLDITAEKEATTLLRIQNAEHKARLETYKVFKKCMDDIQNIVQQAKFSIINKKSGNNKLESASTDEYRQSISLTRREQEVLYLLSMNKSPKEIAQIFSKIENKTIADATVSSIINKQLYPKFDVYNIGQLIEKANTLKAIPFLPESFIGSPN